MKQSVGVTALVSKREQVAKDEHNQVELGIQAGVEKVNRVANDRVKELVEPGELGEEHFAGHAILFGDGLARSG